MKNLILTALTFVVTCSAFTSTQKYNYASTAIIRSYKKPITNQPVFKNNEIHIRQRDSSLAFTSSDAGDVSFLNVLFFIAIYSAGIFFTVESSNVKEKKPEPDVTASIVEVEEVSNDVEDATQSVDDNVEDEPKSDKKSSGSIKNAMKRIFKSEPTEAEIQAEEARILQTNAEKREQDKNLAMGQQSKADEPSPAKEEKPEEEDLSKIIQANAEKREQDRKIAIEQTKADKPSSIKEEKSEEEGLSKIVQMNAQKRKQDKKLAMEQTNAANQYPDITETLKKVASTKESVEERYRLLAQNAKTEEKDEAVPIPEESPVSPAQEDEKETSTPKRNGFRNRVKRIAKKVIMPWRKFSDIQ